MNQVVYRAEGTSLEDVTRNAGYYGLVKTDENAPITGREESAILDSLPSSQRWQVRRGNARVVPRATVTYRNGEDTVRGIDYDLVRVERSRARPVYVDPFWIISGPTAGRTAQFLRELLEEEVRKDVIKAGLAEGVESQLFKVSVSDLSRLLKRDVAEVYDECVQLLISGSVTTMKNAIVPSVETKTTEQKIPIAVR